MKENLTQDEATALKMFIEQKPVKNKSDRMKSIYIRVSPEEKRHIELVASAAGLSTSEMIRQCAMNVKLRSIPPGAFYDLINSCDNLTELIENYKADPVSKEQLDFFAEGFKEDLEELKKAVWFLCRATDEELAKWIEEHPERK